MHARDAYSVRRLGQAADAERSLETFRELDRSRKRLGQVYESMKQRVWRSRTVRDEDETR